MTGLKEIGMHMGSFIEDFLRNSNFKKGEVAEKMNISRNTLTSLLAKDEWPKITVEKFINVIHEMTPKDGNNDNLKLFPLAIPSFIENKRAIVNGLVGQTITVGLVEMFEDVVKKHPFQENLKVQGSVGLGNAARSVWVGIRDERISKSGFSTGVYVVLLFDSKGENAYLSIAYAVSDKDINKLESMATIPATKIMGAIEGDKRYDGVQAGFIDLGDTKGTIAEKYEQSVIVSKRYKVKDMEAAILKNDTALLLNLFYDFVFEEYFEVLEQQMTDASNGSFGNAADESSTRDKRQTGKKREVAKYSTINPETHLKLLADKAEHNRRVGKLAEEFIYASEIEKLIALDREDLLDKVKHVAKEKDGLGYDVESVNIESNGDITEKYIEVKGSSLGGRERFDFYLTERELSVAKEKAETYHLAFVEYVGFEKQRVFDVITPFSESSEDNVISKKPVLFKCSYQK
ncbi:MrcB family domain-containing protein [Planococcus plakortidis]